MAKKIVGVVRPFDRKQNFYVYEDGNKLAIATPTIDEINDTIFSFVDTYDVHQIDLVVRFLFRVPSSAPCLDAVCSPLCRIRYRTTKRNAPNWHHRTPLECGA